MAYRKLQASQRMTAEEFLAWEARHETKHEFVDGIAYAMAGGTAAHSHIQKNIVSRADAKLAGGSCEAYTSDMKVLTGNGRYRYPDASIDCNGVADDEIGLSAPAVVFEVVSDESQHRDRTEKLADYNATPSIRHYVILEQKLPLADVYNRGPHRDFLLRPVTVDGLDGVINLQAVGMMLTMAEVYARVRFVGVQEELPKTDDAC